MKTSSPRAAQRTDSSSSRRSSGQTRRLGQPRLSDQGEPAGSSRSGDGVVESVERRRSLPLQRAEASGGESSQATREAVAHEEIARRAYELWQQDGCPEGCSEQHWLEAERQLRGSSFAGSADGNDARAEARAIKASAERRAGAPARN